MVPAGEPAFLHFLTPLSAGGPALSRVRYAAPTSRALDRTRPPAKNPCPVQEVKEGFVNGNSCATLIAGPIRHRKSVTHVAGLFCGSSPKSVIDDSLRGINEETQPEASRPDNGGLSAGPYG